MSLETARLKLLPFTADLIDALSERSRAERLIGAGIPDGWPDEELKGLLSLYAGWVRTERSFLGYGPWVVIAAHDGVVVGSAGFIGKPDENATIELGFGIHADYRNRGYASEAAGALIAWGLGQPGVERVIARCDPNNAASVRVLEKIGMEVIGKRDGQLLWQAATGRATAARAR